jgi:hypothetical protein
VCVSQSCADPVIDKNTAPAISDPRIPSAPGDVYSHSPIDMEDAVTGSPSSSAMYKDTSGHKRTWMHMGPKAKLTPQSTPVTPRSPAGGLTRNKAVISRFRSGGSSAVLDANADPTSMEVEDSAENPCDSASEEIMHEDDMPSRHRTIVPGGVRSGSRSSASQKRVPEGMHPLLLSCLLPCCTNEPGTASYTGLQYASKREGNHQVLLLDVFREEVFKSQVANC